MGNPFSSSQQSQNYSSSQAQGTTQSTLTPEQQAQELAGINQAGIGLNAGEGFTPSAMAAISQIMGGATGSTVPTELQNGGTNVGNAGFGAFNTGVGNLTNFNTNNLTAPGVLSAANQYMSGYDVPGQVKAAMTAANQNANETTLPQIAANAAGTGNVNSSQTGVASGIVQQGLAETAANLYPEIYAQDYGNSLNLASNNAANANTENLTAGGLLTNGGNSAMGNAISAITGGVNAQGILGALGLGAANAGTTTPLSSIESYLASISGVNAGGTQTGNFSGTQTGQSTGTSTSNPSIWSDVFGSGSNGPPGAASTAGKFLPSS